MDPNITVGKFFDEWLKLVAATGTKERTLVIFLSPRSVKRWIKSASMVCLSSRRTFTSASPEKYRR
ncbi:MAG: hypothetical protein DMD36_17110 [Gemmatimonadetes bacterium]|nr:MAG: hypothetical protein DMD36_17110 [Gemmatimonadota bacterium]